MSTTWVILLSLTWVILVLLSFAWLGLVRQVSEMRLALASMPTSQIARPPNTEFAPGRTLPNIHELEEISGASVFVFMTSTCAPCKQLAEGLAEDAFWHSALAGHMPVLVTDGPGAVQYRELPFAKVVVQADAAVARAMGVSVTPYAVVSDARGAMRAGRVVNTTDDIRALLEAAYPEGTGVDALAAK